MTVNILIVDDEISIRSLLRAALSVEDDVGEIREAADGFAAVNACWDFKPDVVLLDYAMPDRDGATTAEVIRGIHPEARIIAYTGHFERKPPWADDYYKKGDLPDLSAIIHPV